LRWLGNLKKVRGKRFEEERLFFIRHPIYILSYTKLSPLVCI